MRVLVRFLLVLVVGIAVMGCGKKSGVEGKLVDEKGKPIANAKVIAKQAQPIKGYEKFETTTGSDGTFAFKGLYPASRYDLTITPTVEAGIVAKSKQDTIQSGPEGQTSMTDPIAINLRFKLSSKDGIVTDTYTGLQWVPANGQAMLWEEAVNYAKNLSLSGGGWRLPSMEELKGIIGGGIGSTEPAFNCTYNFVWSDQLKDNLAWGLGPGSDERWSGDVIKHFPAPSYSVLAVRSPK